MTASIQVNLVSEEIRFKVEEVKSTEDADWEDWRNRNEGGKTMGGNSFASLCGLGYESAQSTLRRFHNVETRRQKPPKEFLDHGRDCEPLVISAYCSDNYLTADLLDEPVSTKYKATVSTASSSLEFYVITTPDFKEIYGPVYEVKNPYYQLDQFNDCHAYAQWWLSRQPHYGKAQYFLQALWYSYFDAPLSEELTVIVGFFDMEERFIYVTYNYKISEEAKSLVTEKLVFLAHSNDKTNIRITAKEKARIQSIVEQCFIEKTMSTEFFYSISTGSLHKETKDNTRKNAQNVPRKEGLSDTLCGSVLSIRDSGFRDQLCAET